MYVVCGRNVALGVFETMAAALLSLEREGAEILERGPCFVLASDGAEEFTVVELTQEQPFQLPTRLFR